MRSIAIVTLCLALAACGNDAPKPAKRLDTPQEAVARDGDVTIRANVIATAHLNERMTRDYDIPRDDSSVLLMVSVRRGADGSDVSLPATITASATNLQGQTRPIAMREMRIGELTDYIGTAQMTPPETLRFDLKIVREGAAASTMTFSRDFEP
ncbi:MAG: DUF4426 domain-containing protein [Xanthomonadales bacterium]|nr:DUF4426 domain-containing protein [Xanthomonadales bacterium]